MVKVNEEITHCDLCNQPVGSFYYYEVVTSALGVISESRLIIDLCRSCAKKVQHHIPKELMQDRYDSTNKLSNTIEGLIEKLKDAKENAI